MIDSHAHVAFSQFDDDRDEVVARSLEAGVDGWIEIGTDIEQSRRAIDLAEKHENVWATVGVHPSDLGPTGDMDGNSGNSGLDGMDESDWRAVRDLLGADNVVALGEVGLDLYHVWPNHSLREQCDKQAGVLRQFLGLAKERDLPVVCHVRSHDEMDAHDELLKILKDMPSSARPPGVVHTYSGNQGQADEYLNLGLYLSFSGVVTFKNASETAEIAARTPLDRLLIETDAPFLTPDPHRGQRNEPAYVRLVAEKIADLKKVTTDEVAAATDQNTRQLFNLF